MRARKKNDPMVMFTGAQQKRSIRLLVLARDIISDELHAARAPNAAQAQAKLLGEIAKFLGSLDRRYTASS